MSYFERVKPSWLRSVVNWLVNSKFRKYKRLDSFLKEQLFSLSQDDTDLIRSEANKIVTKRNPDNQVIEVLKYVKNNYKYQGDVETYGSNEYWATAPEIIRKGKDDCDGLNTLIYVLCRFKRVPSYLLWATIGSTKFGGHFWLTYFSPKYGKMYPVDATAWVSFMGIPSRSEFKLTDSKYQRIWYLFNENFVFR